MVRPMRLDEYILREKLEGRTMVQLAKKLGISPGALHGIKSGNRTPSFDLARRIFEATDGVVTYHDLADVAPRREAA